MLISKFGGNGIPDKIEEFEDLIGKEMPNQLRDFLLKYNGGETPNTKFDNGEISSDVKVFWGMGVAQYVYSADMLFEYNENNMLSFATDSFGNAYCIDVITGEIFFSDHEKNTVKKIAEDLREFIGRCKSNGINPSSVKSVEERERDLIKRGRGVVITDALREMWRAEIAKYSLMKQEEVII